MRVARLIIRNILGIEELDIAPGTLTKLTGGNGVGKTSILEAVKAVVKGGHDATLLRNGAKDGEIVIMLDDGTELKKRVTPGKSPLKARDANGAPLEEAKRGFLDRLIDSLSANPIGFLTAPASQRANWLLDVMPLTVSAEELSEAVGFPVGDPPVANAIDAIAALRDRIFIDRTGLNRLHDEKKKAADALERQLPPESSGNARQEAGQKRLEISALDKQLAEYRESVRRLLDEEEAEARAEAEEAERKARETAGAAFQAIDEQIRELEKQIAALRIARQEQIAAADKQIARISAAEQKRVAAAKEQANRLFGEKKDRIESQKAALNADIARLEEQAFQHAAADETRKLIERNRIEAEQHAAESARCSSAIERLDELKKRVLERLPIKGLEIKSGQIYLDGVPYDRLNRAKQVQIALRVAKLRAGELPLVLVDNLECLDAETFAAFEQAAEKSGMQFVVTRVTEGPLTITTDGHSAHRKVAAEDKPAPDGMLFDTAPPREYPE